jgi:small-conductance mechanosensitive channel
LPVAAETLSTLEQAWGSIQASIVSLSPKLVAALLILILGWLVALLARRLVARFVNSMRGGLRVFLQREGIERDFLPDSAARLPASALYWLIILVAVALAAEAVGFSLVSAWLSTLVNYVPTLVAGIVIFAIGLLVARLARDLVNGSIRFAQSGQRLLLARVVYFTIVTLALLLGLEQLGVHVSLLVIVFSVGLGAFVGGLLLAFALGSQEFVRNLIAAHQLRQIYDIGQHIRISDHEGVIVSITSVSVTLEIPDGLLVLPAHLLLSEPVALL